jgi:predicted porin
MQKKIIALAVAGLASTAAFAQTNVQIYGIVDAAIAYVHNSQGRDGMAVQTGVLAGNRIGFKGTEDLGNGLKAVFLLEQGFNLDDGTSAAGQTSAMAFQRQAYVGLSSNAGTLTLGRQYAPGYGAFIKHDALGAALLSAGMTLNAASANTIAGNSNARWNNSIKYATPVMGGFQAEAIYRAGEASNDFASNEGYGLGLGFAGGPIAVNYVFHHTDGAAQGSDAGLTAGQWVAVTPNTGAVRDEHFVGATFDAKVLKIMGTAQFTENQGRGLNGRSSVELYTLGTIIPVGKGNLHANYAYLDLNGNDRKNGASGSGQSYAVAFTYGLSKRTTLYTAVNYTDLAGGSAAPSYANATGSAATNALSAQNAANLINGGGNGTTVGFGVNHSF